MIIIIILVVVIKIMLPKNSMEHRRDEKAKMVKHVTQAVLSLCVLYCLNRKKK